MSAIVQTPRRASLNRRRRVRQKVHAPAYATFSGTSRNEMLDLYEVLDISEVGVAVQCPLPMTVDQNVDLCLDLAEASGQISATMRVVWSDADGRVGLSFQPLEESDQYRLRQWLFLNAMAGAANAASYGVHSARKPHSSIASRSSTSPGEDTDTDRFSSVSTIERVEREAELLGSDIEAILALIVSGAQSLFQASGTAIALGRKNTGAMVCRASLGNCAPPVGAVLQRESGFSGECVRTGRTLRCDDSETDSRVDSQSCRALGIRSMLASPIGAGGDVIGLLEVFSDRPHAFSESDGDILERLSDGVLAAVHRLDSQSSPLEPLETQESVLSDPSKPEEISVPHPEHARVFPPGTGSILFAHYPSQENYSETDSADQAKAPGVRLPRAHLYLLIATLATLALAVGFITAPFLQPWVQKTLKFRGSHGNSTVQSSSQNAADSLQPLSGNSTVDSANPQQLRTLAEQGNAEAENAMGLLYAQGDQKQAIKQDEAEAARWFTKAAEHGSVPAQYKLGLLYWGGHGVPKDPSKAYFWTVLARASGQPGSKDLANVLANGMSRSQAAAIEQKAEIWYQQHESNSKTVSTR